MGLSHAMWIDMNRLYDSGLAADSQNGMQTVVALGEADTRNIKADRSLCRSSADCYIQADAGIVMDWNPPLSNLNLASDPVPITTFIGKGEGTTKEEV